MKYYHIILLSFFFISCKDQPKSDGLVDKAVISIKSNAKDKSIVSNSKNTKVIFINKEFVLGKFNYRKDSAFIKVNSKYSTKEIFLNKEVNDSFISMNKAASKHKVNLVIVSGTRNFHEQKAIWERKWEIYRHLDPIARARKILEYSSMPSTSRHHWGTDIDINNLNNSYFHSGKGKKEYDWLKLNAGNYGFCQVYTSQENGRTGYNEEKWHWSFLPLAKEYLKFYNNNIRLKDIEGFKGNEFSKDIEIINNYVMGISTDCK